MLIITIITVNRKKVIFLLYTVVPLERIYVDQSTKNQSKNEETEPEYKDVMINHGRVITRREGKNFIVQRINSTDMSDYLNSNYSPGKIV
jgi:hypothetical protein